MLIYPAIDLKGGACVRLLRGDMATATVHNLDPADQARRFQEFGFRWLHLVDLDGAVAGRAVNGEAVAAILAAVSMPVQLGGGIRDMAAIEGWLARGVARVVLGTAAVREPSLVVEACRAFPGRIVLGLDAREGRLAVAGWAEQSEIEAVGFAQRCESDGLAAIVYTDIARDGALSGPNVAATRALAAAVSVPVIASGGVSSLGDLRELAAERIAGAIVGKAFYTGAIDPTAALALEVEALEVGNA